MAYNQSPSNQHVRIGNWFEELRLVDETGIRYYSDPKDKKISPRAGTRERCFIHTEQTLPKDYSTTVRDGYVDPQSRPETKWAQSGLGPRARLVERSIGESVDRNLRAASAVAKVESLRVDYTSEAKSRFTKENFAPALKERDASIRHFTPHANFISDVPITIYSDSIMRGSMVFPSSFVCSTNPFRKNNRFSIPDKLSTCKPKAECNERPRALPTSQDFMILCRFRSRLLDHVKSVLKMRTGGSVRAIITALWRAYISDKEKEGIIADSYILYRVDEVLNSAFGISVEPKELTSILSTFEVTGASDGVALIDFSIFLRPIPEMRRLELIQDMFNTINNSILEDNSQLDKEIIRLKYRGADGAEVILQDLDAIRGAHGMQAIPCASPNKMRSNERTGLREITSPTSINSRDAGSRASTPAKGISGNGYTIDDFIDYYCDISSELQLNDDFENYLVASWKV